MDLESMTSSLKAEHEMMTSSLRQQLEKANAEVVQLRNEKVTHRKLMRIGRGF
jgi:hypothetical protein